MRISDWSSDVCSSDLSFALDTGTFDIQAGGKARLRKKTFEYTQDKYDGVDGELTLADVLGRQSYSLADIEPVVGKEGERDLLAGGFDRFILNPIDTLYESSAADYSGKEAIYQEVGKASCRERVWTEV